MIVEKPGRVGKLRVLDELEKTSRPVYASVSVGRTVNFKLVVYVDDECAPCDLILESVLDVEGVNKHVLFELVNISYVKPEFRVYTTPTVYVVSTQTGKPIGRVQSVTPDEKLNVKLVEDLLVLGYIYTHPYTEKLVSSLQSVARAHNLYLNRHETVRKLITSILKNYDEYGYPLCPCRKPAWSSIPREELAEHLEEYACPCASTRVHGDCTCGLLVREKRTPGYSSLVDYLDYLSQTAIRMVGLVDVLREDDPRSASLALSHGWLHVLMELRMTVDNMYMEICKSPKTTE